MPLTELESKEALRAATDWLVMSDPPGGFAAREGISAVIPLVMMGALVPRDLDDLASIVEQNGDQTPARDVSPEEHRAQLGAAVRAAFAHVKSRTDGPPR